MAARALQFAIAAVLAAAEANFQPGPPPNATVAPARPSIELGGDLLLIAVSDGGGDAFCPGVLIDFSKNPRRCWSPSQSFC